MAADDPLFDIVVDEIAYARQPPVHEGRRSSYGALVGADADWSAAGVILPLPHVEPSECDIDRIRKVCNGRTTFLVRSTAGPENVLELNAYATEQELAQLVSPLVRVVQRTPGGAVKVFTPSRIYVFEHDEWWQKVYSSDAARRLEQALFPNGPDPAVDVLGGLLSFCLHILSARHIGATFVWYPGVGDATEPVSRDAGARPPAVLHTNDRSSTEPLATFLDAIDGACVVGPDGRVDHVEVKLSPSPLANSLIAAERGLRHTSAKRYSFDDPHCLVFVVSHDGPVTVYSDGMSVLQLRVGPSYGWSIAGVAPREVFGSRRPKACPGCRKELMIERVHSQYKDKRMTIDCPVCGHADLVSDNAVAMLAWPRKPWTRSGVGAWLPRPSDDIG